MTVKRNIVIQQGATWFQRIGVVGCDNLPIDLSGYTVDFSARDDLSGTANVFLSGTTEDGKINIVDNVIEIEITPAVSNAIDVSTPVKQGVYDIELTDLDGRVTRAYTGDIDIERNV